MTVLVEHLATESAQRRYLDTAQRNIDGFTVRAAHDEEGLRRKVTYLLPQSPDGGLIATHYLGAIEDGQLRGGAMIHAEYGHAVDLLASRDPAWTRERIVTLLQSRRTLSGLFVDEGLRGRGIGSALVAASIECARQEGARWLTGFMDEGNGSPDFYAARGFTVQAPNQPLPRLAPAFLPELHPRSLRGSWFYMDLDAA